jgi:hypothetical protein
MLTRRRFLTLLGWAGLGLTGTGGLAFSASYQFEVIPTLDR